MLNILLLITFSMFTFMSIECASITCANSYAPDQYKGHLRVPTSCSLQTLSCPRSWKSGIPQGRSSTTPLIYSDFVKCHEGFLICGYVPIDSKTGEVLEMSGVTIGGGVDLGSKNRAYFSNIGVETLVIDALEPYFDLKQDQAACAIIENPFSLQSSQAETLTNKVKDFIVSQVQTRYDNERNTADTLSFASLPRAMRTAISDVWFQFGSPAKFPLFWGYVTRNDWEGAVRELRNFYTSDANPSNGDQKRRNNEADIISAALEECDRSADIVFLLDQSGSIQTSDFSLALNFIMQIINAFPDENLSDEKGTRFALSLFDSSYEKKFGLLSHMSKLEYNAALNSISQSQGSTQLGNALNMIEATQFTEQNGLRPVTQGFPKVLIIMTDGRSHDSVTTPAANVRSNNVVIYAIGIGSYELNQLQAVASSSNHIYTLVSFLDLGDFAATLTASTCNVPQPLPFEIEIVGLLKKDQFQYYEFKVQVGRNLQVVVIDLFGFTILFASRETQHPYEFDNDFRISSNSRKVIVISPVSDSTDEINRNRRNSEANATYPIYVSVKGTSNNNSFTLVGGVCDPTICIQGTSGANPLQVSISVLILACAIFITF